MEQAIDIIGQRFRRLVVVKRDYSKPRKRPYWLCKCDCGEETIVRGSHLQEGNIKSCGCLREEVEDMIGQKFGKLIVIKRAGEDRYRHTMWLCKCECGKEKVINVRSLKGGLTKSCGCLNKFDIGVANMRAAMGRYKAGAIRRKLEWDLTLEQFAEITKKDCHYCGAKPNNIAIGKGYNGDYIYNGIDRIDNNKGYTIDNIVSCCKICNFAKRELTLQEFQDWVEKIYNRIFKYNIGG